MREYPDCAYDGDFYCNHLYDPKYPWCWVDFRFFHTRLKRYFAVAMTTCEYQQIQINENVIDDELDKILPYDGPDLIFGKIDPKTDTGSVEFANQWREHYNSIHALREAMLSELNSKPQKTRPSIDVKDYGPVAVGLWVTVNTPFIDEHVIRDFIKFYRSIGEPTTPGFTWVGEEVEIVPARLNERYANQS